MSSTAVPTTVPTLLRALEERDLETVHAQFTPDAAIEDEGETVHGRAGVERWATRAFGYNATYTIDDVAAGDEGETVVTTTTAGDFPGSPLVFRWHVTFAGDRIASLRIDL